MARQAGTSEAVRATRAKAIAFKPTNGVPRRFCSTDAAQPLRKCVDLTATLPSTTNAHELAQPRIRAFGIHSALGFLKSEQDADYCTEAGPFVVLVQAWSGVSG